MRETMPSDAQSFFGEIEQREAERLQAERIEKQLDSDLKAVLETKAGRHVLSWILETTGIDESVTNMDPLKMLYASARRDLGLSLSTRLKALGVPNLISQMEHESNERRGNT